MLTNDEPRSVEEAYVSATTTSDLKLRDSDLPTGSADYIVAAGLSKSAAGACFIRLHGEWSSSEKPRMPTKEAIKKLADSLTFDQLAKMRIDLKISTIGNLKPTGAVAEIAAHAQARAWYIAEVEMLLGKLKSFRAAEGHITAQMVWEGDTRQEVVQRQVATEVLIWWLDKQCPKCNGTKYQIVSGTNRHSNRLCPRPNEGGCGGTGEAKLPRGDEGRRLANLIDDCCQIARTSIKKRLRRH